MVCSSTSTFYPGSKLSELLDYIFAGYLFLCLIDPHGKTSLCGSQEVTLDPGQTELLQIFCVLKSTKPSFGWHTQQVAAATITFSGTRTPLPYVTQLPVTLELSDHSIFMCSLTLQSVLNQKLTCQP